MTDHRARETHVADDDERGLRRLVRRSIRALVLSTGVGVFAVGLLAVVDPETAELLPVETAVETLGSDYLVVAVVGLLAVGLTAVVLSARRLRGVREASPPVVEGVQSATYPGKRLDRPASGHQNDGPGKRDRLKRLREAATVATMRADGCSRRVAQERVAEGHWTDDAVASAYLSDRTTGSAGWIRRLTGGDERAIRRTVDAIERHSGHAGGSGGEESPDSNVGREEA